MKKGFPIKISMLEKTSSQKMTSSNNRNFYRKACSILFCSIPSAYTKVSKNLRYREYFPFNLILSYHSSVFFI